MDLQVLASDPGGRYQMLRDGEGQSVLLVRVGGSALMIQMSDAERQGYDMDGLPYLERLAEAVTADPVSYQARMVQRR